MVQTFSEADASVGVALDPTERMGPILPGQLPAPERRPTPEDALTWDDNAQRQAWPGKTAPPGVRWRLGDVSDGRDARDFRDAVKPVVLPERQEPLDEVFHEQILPIYSWLMTSLAPSVTRGRCRSTNWRSVSEGGLESTPAPCK